MKSKRDKITGCCFWLVFVVGYDLDHAKIIAGSLEKWQLDELSELGSKAWKFLERAIIRNYSRSASCRNQKLLTHLR